MEVVVVDTVAVEVEGATEDVTTGVMTGVMTTAVPAAAAAAVPGMYRGTSYHYLFGTLPAAHARSKRPCGGTRSGRSWAVEDSTLNVIQLLQAKPASVEGSLICYVPYSKFQIPVKIELDRS